MEDVQVDVAPGRVLMVRGPAAVSLAHGDVSVLGAPLGKGKVLVRHGKALPFECSSPARVVISLGSQAEYSQSAGRVGVKLWAEVVRCVGDGRPKRTLLLGGTDSGKSTLAAYLANRALRSGGMVGIVDGDVGQGDLAPPTCMGAAIIASPLTDLRDLEAERVEFVGSTSPEGAAGLVAEKLESLTSYLEAKGCDQVIINTDGLVSGEGADYKSRLVDDLKPDLTVCIRGEPTDLWRRLVWARGNEGIVLADGPEVSKGHAERVERRLLQYRRFLQGCRTVILSFERVRFSFMGEHYVKPFRTPKGLGKATPWGGTLKFEGLPSSRIRGSSSSRGVTFPINHIKGLFVGVGRGEDILGFGLVDQLRDDGKLLVQTPARGRLDKLYLSTSRLLDGMTREESLEVRTPAPLATESS